MPIGAGSPTSTHSGAADRLLCMLVACIGACVWHTCSCQAGSRVEESLGRPPISGDRLQLMAC